MDCRKALPWLALLVIAGCQTVPLDPADPKGAPKNPSPPTNAAAQAPAVPPPAATAAKEADRPKKKPTPATCVAAGQFLEREATLSKIATPLEKQQELDKARRAYQQALSLNPNYIPAYCALGHLYADLGDYERAWDTYQKGLKKNAKDPGLWHDVGMFHARKKEWDPAISCLSKAVEFDPENRQYTNALGFCLARAGRYQESLSLFGKSCGQAVAYYNVGRMLHHNQQDELSRQYLQQALRLNPNFPEAEQLLASLDAAAGGTVTVGFQEGGPGNP
jgi:tetratricopeptide (TPR) repeat protein